MNQSEFENIKNKSDVIGNEMFDLMEELFPICRSITGNGVRETLKIIQKIIPLEIHEVKTNTKVYDWTIPKEWNISDGYILDPQGKKILDFKKSNLHVLNYSQPINKKLSLQELKNHIYTIPEKPNFIPYVTSYYSEKWGFCMEHTKFENLKDGEYEVNIISELKEGSLTYGEYLIPGKTEKEILLTCYICHPSMCNDNLSGTVLLTMLGKYLKNMSTNYSIRFLFIPETIGAITWLQKNEKHISKIKHGLVATCLGDSGILTYKKTREGDLQIDEVVEKILKETSKNFRILDFFPWGSDERQFCSPGFNLPIGSVLRSIYGKNEFPEYHTSADNLNFMNKKSLSESFRVYLSIIFELEIKIGNSSTNKSLSKQRLKIQNKNTLKNDAKYLNLNPKCEPQLGKRGIYHELGGQENLMDKREIEFAIFWVLNLSDGNWSVHEISQRSGISLEKLQTAIEILLSAKLLKKLNNDS